MAQKANTELIENLRPFLANWIQKQVILGAMARGGTNIDIDNAGYVSLSPNVQIQGVLRMGKNASFEMIAPITEEPYRLGVTNDSNGNPYLAFMPATDWEGVDFTLPQEAPESGITINVDTPAEQTLGSGNNITVDASGTVNLNLNVEIQGVLRVNGIELYDPVADKNWRVAIAPQPSEGTGQHYLAFYEPSEWEGLTE